MTPSSKLPLPSNALILKLPYPVHQQTLPVFQFSSLWNGPSTPSVSADHSVFFGCTSSTLPSLLHLDLQSIASPDLYYYCHLCYYCSYYCFLLLPIPGWSSHVISPLAPGVMNTAGKDSADHSSSGVAPTIVIHSAPPSSPLCVPTLR